MAPSSKIVEVRVLKQQVRCNQCNKLSRLKLKTKSHGINTKETYLVCPHCKARYTAFVLDGECRKLQGEIRKLQRSKNTPAQAFANNRIDEDEYNKVIDDINNEIENVQAILKSKMDRLKEALT